jgi:hypothetical protein
MLNYLVGPIDINGAFVLVAMCIGGGIIFTTLIVNYRSRAQLTMQFEIDKMKLHNEDNANQRLNNMNTEVQLTRIATDRDVNIRRIETGLIEGKAE